MKKIFVIILVIIWFLGFIYGTDLIDRIISFKNMELEINEQSYFESLWIVFGFLIYLITDYYINKYFRFTAAKIYFLIYLILFVGIGFAVYETLDIYYIFIMVFVLVGFGIFASDRNEKHIKRLNEEKTD